MSKLLINEPPLQVLPSLAKEIGLNEAIVLQQINYWLQTSKHVHDGRRWIYNSTREWVEKEFSFMSESTLKRTLTNLKKMDLIESKKLAKHTGYHVNYYTINFGAMAQIESKLEKIKQDEIKELGNSIGSNCNSIGSNCTDEQVNMNQSRLGQYEPTITESTKRLSTEIKEEPKKERPKPYSPVKPELVSDDVWSDLLQHRRDKKTSNTKTAWNVIYSQLDKAQKETGHSLNKIIGEWLSRDWKGFKADWYLNTVQQPTRNNQGLQDAKQSKLNELEQYINSYGTEQEIRHVN